MKNQDTKKSINELYEEMSLIGFSLLFFILSSFTPSFSSIFMIISFLLLFSAIINFLSYYFQKIKRRSIFFKAELLFLALAIIIILLLWWLYSKIGPAAPFYTTLVVAIIGYLTTSITTFVMLSKKEKTKTNRKEFVKENIKQGGFKEYEHH